MAATATSWMRCRRGSAWSIAGCSGSCPDRAEALREPLYETRTAARAATDAIANLHESLGRLGAFNGDPELERPQRHYLARAERDLREHQQLLAGLVRDLAGYGEDDSMDY